MRNHRAHISSKSMCAHMALWLTARKGTEPHYAGANDESHLEGRDACRGPCTSTQRTQPRIIDVVTVNPHSK